MSEKENVADVEEFLSGPLAQWFLSCLHPVTDEKVTYEEIIDGPLLQYLLLKTCRTKFGDLRLNPSTSRRYPSSYTPSSDDLMTTTTILPSGGVTTIRSQNLETFLMALRRYYDMELDRILVRLPDVSKLAREPRLHTKEIKLMLSLLLGCAVSCERQAEFIEGIQNLDKQVQLGLAQCIIEVQIEPGLVLGRSMLNKDPNESEEEHSKRMDEFFEAVRNLDRERNDYHLQLQNGKGGNKRVNEVEANLRTTSKELERVIDELTDREEKIEQYRVDIEKLKKENDKLSSEARSLNYYRDELDIAQEKASKTDQLELEVYRLKRKLDDFEYSKNSLGELREEMRLFSLKKASLDEELGILRGETRAKTIKISFLEKRLEEMQKKMDETSSENKKLTEEYENLKRANANLLREQQQAAARQSTESSTSAFTLEPLSTSISKAESSNLTSSIPATYVNVLLIQQNRLCQMLKESQRQIRIKDEANAELKRNCLKSLDENKRLTENIKKLILEKNPQLSDPYHKVNIKKENIPADEDSENLEEFNYYGVIHQAKSNTNHKDQRLPERKHYNGESLTERIFLEKMNPEMYRSRADTVGLATISKNKQISSSKANNNNGAFFNPTPIVPMNNRRRNLKI
ncbi:hypothetical protein QAD02_006514 [Eretmocerus hayati]|uniref:Uncharacterized protein n=1 Tax=Eretmocerus hayati TaxID=131215 RepID=A0ACC2N1F8_9HYME|nr:hypothetical protein QAD02_006514 [Eretmocerus hayati]